MFELEDLNNSGPSQDSIIARLMENGVAKHKINPRFWGKNYIDKREIKSQEPKGAAITCDAFKRYPVCKKLYQYYRSLEPLHKACIRLMIVNKFETIDIAKAQGITVDNVKKIRSGAYAEMRKLLQFGTT